MRAIFTTLVLVALPVLLWCAVAAAQQSVPGAVPSIGFDLSSLIGGGAGTGAVGLALLTWARARLKESDDAVTRLQDELKEMEATLSAQATDLAVLKAGHGAVAERLDRIEKKLDQLLAKGVG